MMNKKINNFIAVWIVLDILCLPFVFAESVESEGRTSKTIVFNKDEAAYFGRVSVADGSNINAKKEDIPLKNTDVIVEANQAKEDAGKPTVKTSEKITKKPLLLCGMIYYLIVILLISAIRLNSKAQIQMGESIAVLMIFMILIGLGAIFMINVMSGSVEKTRGEDMQLKAIDIAQKVSFLPELQCSEENIVVEPCVDLLKLDVAATVISDNTNDYYPFFEYSTIRVKEIFPDPAVDWTLLYNKTDDKKKTARQINMPTALYDAPNKAYKFGWIEITVYS